MTLFALMVSKSFGKLILYAVLIVALLFGLIKVLARGGQKFLILELGGIFLLLIFSIFGFVRYHTKWGEPLLGTVFLLYLINLVLIWLQFKTLYIVLLVLALAGFCLALFTEYKKPVSPSSPEAQTMFYNDFNPTMKVAQETSVNKNSASFIPGKFVASKQSNQFHEPKCDWAKKIRSERRIWFSSKQEAWEKGYRSHSCLQ